MASDQDLVQKLQSECKVNGIDWAGLVQQFGPVLVQIIAQLLSRTPPLMAATADTAKIKCGPEQITKLDECIKQCTDTLATMACHRQCCVE